MQTVNTFTRGLDTDTNPAFVKADNYTDAVNVSITRIEEKVPGSGLDNYAIGKWSSYYQHSSSFGYPNITGNIIATAESNNYAAILTYNPADGYNYMYRVDTSDPTGRPVIHPVLKSVMGIAPGRVLVDNNKVSMQLSTLGNGDKVAYIVDGEHELLTVNLTKYTDGQEVDPNAFAQIPIVGPQQMSVIINDGGHLPSGNIAWAVQYYNNFQLESSISGWSRIYSLYDYTNDGNIETYKATGNLQGTLSNKRADISVYYNGLPTFDSIRLYRVQYTEGIDHPTVYIVTEAKLSTGASQIVTLTDTGSSISTLTTEELATEYKYSVVAKSVSQLDNRLFLGNVSDTVFDVVYDARAYSGDSSGNVTLGGNYSATFSLDAIPDNIPEYADCLNVDNDPTSANNDTGHFYGGKITTSDYYDRGGIGKNVRYRVSTGRIAMDNRAIMANGEYLPNTTGRSSAPTTTAEQFVTCYPYKKPLVSLTDMYTVPIDDTVTAGLPLTSHYLNYTDPQVTAKFRTHFPDEVYRYGVVLMDDKLRRSPVHWIADIKIPLEDPIRYEAGFLNATPYLIDFKLYGLPQEVKHIQLVRADRNSGNASVICQAAFSHLFLNKINDTLTGLIGTNTLVGNLFPTAICSSTFKTLDSTDLYPRYSIGATVSKEDGTITEGTSATGADFKTYVSDLYYQLISPDVHYNSINANDLKSAIVHTQQGLVSVMSSVVGYNVTNSFASATRTWNSTDLAITDNDSYINGVNILGPEGGLPYICMYGNAVQSFIDAAYYSKLFIQADNLYYDKFTKLADVVKADPIPYNQLDPTTETKPYVGYNYTPIGNTQYLDTVLALFINSRGRFGYGGGATVCNIPGAIDVLPILSWSVSVGSNSYPGWVSVRKALIKHSSYPYGGNTYNDRLNTSYIEATPILDVTDGSVDIYGVGGDAYIGVYDYLHGRYYQGKDVDFGADSRSQFNALIPFVSNINLSITSGDTVSRTYVPQPDDTFSTGYNNGQLSNTQLVDNVTAIVANPQDRPYYVYNTSYSAENNVYPFVLNNYLNTELDQFYRVMYSDPKIVGELNDSYLSFKINNYIDVDQSKGSITNLLGVANRLFFFQPNSVGYISVNERSLITDGNNSTLSLGDGGVATHYEYVSYNNGSSTYFDYSILSTPLGVTWFDFDSNCICMLSDNVIDITGSNNVRKFMWKIANAPASDRRNAFTVYDNLTDKLIYTIDGINKPNEDPALNAAKLLTIVYSNELKAFETVLASGLEFPITLALNTILPLYQFGYLTFMHKDNTINVTTKVTDTVAQDSSFLFVVNNNSNTMKVFDNMQLLATFWDANNLNPNYGLLGSATLFNSIQFESKGYLSTLDLSQILQREGTYSMPIQRQGTTDRIRGNYLKVTAHLNSHSVGSDYSIPAIVTDLRESKI